MDISVIMAFHDEGRVAHRTFRTFRAAIYHAHSAGNEIEVIAILDRVTDPVLKEIVKKWEEVFEGWLRWYEVDFGCRAATRNFGLEQANGRYIGILDGDHLCSRNWLGEAHLLCSIDDSIIAHPECSYWFSRENHLWLHEENPPHSNFLERNQWPSPVMAHVKTFRAVPYRTRAIGLGGEDWLWNCETLARGYSHRLAGNTLVAARMNSGEGSPPRCFTSSASMVVPPNPLYRYLFLEGVNRKRTAPTVPQLASSTQRLASFRTIKEELSQKVLDLLRRRYSRTYNLAKTLRKDVKTILQTTLNAGRNFRQTYRAACPKWVEEELKVLSQFEPEITGFSQPFLYRAPASRLGAFITPEMSELVSAKRAKVFLLRAMVRGGSELEAVHYMHCLPSPVFVVTTSNEPHPWLHLLPKDSVHIDIGNNPLNNDERRILLLRLLLEADLELVHIVNSHTGFEMFIKHPHIWEHAMRVATFFCTDIGPDGLERGYALSVLPRLLDFFTYITTDNRAFRRRLIEMYGIPQDKIVSHRMPFSPPHLQMVRNCDRPGGFDDSDYHAIGTERPLKVLFAGRFAPQKRPDLALRVARELIQQGMKLEVDFWGTNVPGLKRFDFPNPAPRGVRLMGPFEGLASIPLENYDVMFLPSAWEGLPNSLIESMGNGLPVVAADVGGVREIVNEETGWLIRDHDNVESYKRVFRQIIDNPGEIPAKSARSLQFVQSQHSWEKFRARALEMYYGQQEYRQVLTQ
ncbi:MAG: glycosyltransferase [Thermodesulfobacteriota bacterium]